MFFNLFKKKNDVHEIDKTNLPMHIGIIMDGNGRWAKKRNLPRNFGHRAGAETLKKITTYADEIGIKAITAYTFSTENWKRFLPVTFPFLSTVAIDVSLDFHLTLLLVAFSGATVALRLFDLVS